MSAEEWGKIFDAHDIRMERRLPKMEVQHCVRSCGRLLLPAQMRKLLDKYGEPMTRSDFLDAMKTPIEGEPKPKDIGPAFSAFDARENGMLTRHDLSQIFTSMTEKITPAELEEVLKGFKPVDGGKGKGELYPVEALTAHFTMDAKKMRVSSDDVNAVLR